MPSAPRHANRIIATAVGLMVLVCTVVGLLGWRLLSQEAALADQQVRDRLLRTAEQIASKFSDRLQELDAWLGSGAPLAAGGPPTLGGAIVVWLSNAGVHVAPQGRLLYYPVIPAAPRVERNNIPAEAMLEEARALGNKGEIDGALSKYEDLYRLFGDADLLMRENAMTGGLLELLVRSDPSRSMYWEPADVPPRLLQQVRSAMVASRLATQTNPKGVPYRLLTQFEIAQLLSSSGRHEEAQERARRLVSEMSSGRWALDKATFTSYDTAARKIAGLPPPPAARVAVAEQVDRLWSEWRPGAVPGEAMRSLRPRSAATRIWDTDPPLVALVNTNPDRLVALIADGDSLPSLGLDLSKAGESVGASLVDENGRWILGQPSSSAGLVVERALSGSGLPWQLRLIDNAGQAGTVVRARRSYAITAFSVFVLLVAGACYAIARGVLREAKAGQLQGDFVSAVSHEFRSPLTALRQLTELLAQGRVQDESRRRVYFQVLEKETSRLHRLVEDLLDFGRMDAGRGRYQFQPTDVSQLVEHAIDDYRREADANGHQIEFAARDGAIIVNADHEALRRVVRNLLENAVKYSPGAAAVWVDTACDDRTALLRVRDEGIGVPLEEQSRIFEKFVRGEAAKRACIQGTGIGLSMVKEIVSAHHGRVTLQSEVGRGSTFTVRLPLSAAHQRRIS